MDDPPRAGTTDARAAELAAWLDGAVEAARRNARETRPATRSCGSRSRSRAYIDTLDPGSWRDRARRTGRPGRRDELIAFAEALDRLDLAPALRRLFGRLATDRLRLGAVDGGSAEVDDPLPLVAARLAGLHALIHRLWLTATRVSALRPGAGGVTREAGNCEEPRRAMLEPMRRDFDLVHGITGVIQHEVAAFG